MSDRVRTGLLSLALCAVLVLAAGCGGNSFVGRHYDNFTAYYNTFYNARTAFDEGVKALQQDDEPVDRRYYVNVFASPVRAANNDRFQNAIDKSADVLRDHPDSKWVDDALLLIGKSYFYQHNFVGAEQKFREVIDIGSALEDEARLWLARTLTAAGAYDEARDHLVASLNQEDLSDRWKPRIHLALGELYVGQESFEEAAEQLELGLEEVRDNDLEARGWLLLGQVLETLGRYEDAVAAYERVSRAHPRYELSYAANVSAVRVRGMHLDAEHALRDLRRMQRDDKNFSNRFELAYLQGLIYQAEGRVNDARDQYHGVLYDSDGQIGDLRGRIHYALGELYSNDHEDFLMASAHYDTARTSLSSNNQSGTTEEQYAPEAIIDAPRKAEIYSTFADVRGEVARMDSLLELGSLSDEEFTERIMEIRQLRAKEMSEQQRIVEQRQAERGFQDAAAGSAAQTRSAASEATGEAGFLFHRDPIRVQESRMSFITRWGDRPHVPNWRRSEAVAAASSDRETADGATAQRIADNSAGVDQNPLPQIDYSDVPRDSLSRARLLAARALARYELGNVLFLAMERPDSAAAWYRMVIEQDPGESVAQRAYYALAEVQKSLGDTAAANTIYQQVLRDYPESDFAGRVREQLGVQSDVPSDSVSMAFEEYQSAFFRWRQGHHRLALNDMVTVAARHQRTEAAPKALLAAGRIFLEWAEQDTMDIFGPLPLTVNDKVLEEAGLRGHFVERAAPSQQASREEANPNAPVDDAPIGRAKPQVEASETDLDALKAAERSAADERPPTPPRRVGNGQPADGHPAQNGQPTGDSLGTSSDEVDTPANGAPSVDDQLVRADNAADSTSVMGGAPQSDSTSIADSVVVAVGVVPGRQETSAEVVEPEADDNVYLEMLYASIQNRYPETVYAEQAAEMLQALETHRAELREQVAAADAVAAADSMTVQPDSVVATDTLARAGADSAWSPPDTAVVSSAASEAGVEAETALSDTTSQGIALVDSTETIDRPASSEQPATNQTARAEPPAAAENPTQPIPTGEESIRGSESINAALGGYTIVVGMNVQKPPMDTLAQEYAAKGFRSGVVEEKVGSTTLYRAAVGQFRTIDFARRALARFKEELGGGAQVAPLTNSP